MSADAAAVTIEGHGPVAIVRMDRPKLGNAVGPAQMERLCECLDAVIDDPETGAIVLSHTGRHFIAGADFAFLADIPNISASDIRTQIYSWFQGAARRLHLCPKPTVAAIGGAAITVGCELAIACDFRVVTDRALFQESWIKLGLIAPLGGGKLLPQMVGWSIAKEMLLMGRAVSGTDAVRLGLATELVDEPEREARAIALAQELAGLAPLAYAAGKQSLWQGLQVSFDEGWETGVETQSQLLKSHDHAEAFAALSQKRAAVFRGR